MAFVTNSNQQAGGKHLGYAGNITESVGETGSLVTDYAYEQNIYSDNRFLKDHLEAEPVYAQQVTLVAGGAYSGEANILSAQGHNVRLVATNFTGHKPADIFAEFLFDETRRILLECGSHKKPVRTHYDEHNDRCNAYFAAEDCKSCPYKEQCAPNFSKSRTTALREISWKAVNRAKMIRYMNTEEFHEPAHFRNGVESIPSLLRRRYRVDKIPAHGKKRTRTHFGFKIAALNFQGTSNNQDIF